MIPTMRLPLRPVGVACMCLVLVLACLGPCAPVTVTADTPSRPQRAPSLRMASPPDWAAAKGAADHPKLAQPLALLRAHGASQPPAEGVTGLRLHNGRVQVRIACDAANLEAVERCVAEGGGEVTGTAAGGRIVQAWVPPAMLDALAAAESVDYVGLPADAVSFEPQVGTATTEALAAMGATTWHAAGHRGAGVAVGLIEAGYQGYASLIGSDLPAAISVRNFVDGEALTEVEGSTAAGTAFAEIVHDVAPEATLYLARVQTDVDLEEAVQWLMASGIDVIATSLVWLNVTPGDGSGYLADLVAMVREAGIVWVSSAGDLRLHHWGGSFSDPDGDGVHDFGPSANIGDYLGAIPAGVPLEVYLRWDDWTTVTTDFDLVLLRYNPSSQVWEVIGGSWGYQYGQAGQTPTEYAQVVTYGETTYYGFAILRWDAARAVHFEVFAGPYPLYEPVPARSLPNLPDAPMALSVSAVDAAAPHLHEEYSSEGPTNGPGGTASGGYIKPNLAAYDSVSTASYGARTPSGAFAGARAAAAHVAGAAALVRGAYPGYTPSQVQALLASRAVDMGTIGLDTVYGHGRLHLGAAPSATPIVTRTPTRTPTTSPTPTVKPRTPTRTPTTSPTPTVKPRTARPVRLPLMLRGRYQGRRFLVNDPYYDWQWGMAAIGVEDAWPLGSGAGIVVAVVDSGVDMFHPDLASKLVGGYDVANGDSWPQDNNGHGTHVAGIVGAVTGNGIGVAGVGWDTRIMPVKVLDDEGRASAYEVATAIERAVDGGARIINLSLGSAYRSDLLESATTYAYARGVLVIASAGNSADEGNPVTYPAANPNVLAVGATTPDGRRATFSEYGWFVDLAAPGVEILSTFWDAAYGSDYAFGSGTSQAAPFVSGLASLVWSRNPALTNDQVAGILMGTATDLGPAGRDDQFGYGLINARAAVRATAAGHTLAAAMPTEAPLEASVARALAQEARESDTPVRPGVVLLRPGPTFSTAALPTLLGVEDVEIDTELSALGYLRLRVPEGQERDVAARLMAEGSAIVAEPDYVLTLWD
jgi:subtilisin family serine protease